MSQPTMPPNGPNPMGDAGTNTSPAQWAQPAMPPAPPTAPPAPPQYNAMPQPSQQSYAAGYPATPLYGSQYPSPAAHQRPGFLSIDFWLPKTKAVAATVFAIPVIFGLAWFILCLVFAGNSMFNIGSMIPDLSGYPGSMDLSGLNSLLSMLGSLKATLIITGIGTLLIAIMAGLLGMLAVLAGSKALQYLKDTHDHGTN